MKRLCLLVAVVMLVLAACGDGEGGSGTPPTGDDSGTDSADSGTDDGSTDDGADDSTDGGTDGGADGADTSADGSADGTDATDAGADDSTDAAQPEPPTAAPEPADGADTESSTDDDGSGFPVWAWIILGIAAVIIVAAIINSARPKPVPPDDEWRRRGHNVCREGQVIVDQATLPAAAPEGSLLTVGIITDVQSRIDQLLGQLPSMAAAAPSDASRELVLQLGDSARSLRAALETERALQLQPTQGTLDQLVDASRHLTHCRTDFDTGLRGLSWALEPVE